MNKESFKSHEDLAIFKLAFDTAMKIFELSQDLRIPPRRPPNLGGTGFTPPKVGGLGGQNDGVCVSPVSKRFPVEEKYSLTDQIRRSSRSVCANLAEAWRKRRYKAAFIAKLNDCVSEAAPKELGDAAETQAWIKFAVKCSYLDIEQGRELYGTYNQVLSGLVNMINNPNK